jgi:DNA modification methylase
MNTGPTEQRHLEYLPLDDLAGAVRNPKGHDLPGIEASIARFGFVSPSILDGRTHRLVAGHGRILALRGMRERGQAPPAGVRLADDGGWLVPVLNGWASRSDAEADAYLVADNEWTIRGAWDDDQLGTFLTTIADADPDLLAVTGFTTDDLTTLLTDGTAPHGRGDPADDDEEIPEPPADPVTRPGDIWRLGPHRIICGDCRDPDTFTRLLGDTPINVAFTSPPYASQRAYDPASAFRPIPPDDYVEWFAPVQDNIRAVLTDDGSWLINIKEHCEGGQRSLYVKDLTIAHVRLWGWRFIDELCWKKNGLPGTWPNRFKNEWEPVFHFSKDAAITFHPEAVGHASDDVFREHGRISDSNRTGNVGWHGSDVTRLSGVALPGNVVTIASNPMTMQNRGINHSAAFPVALPAWFIRAYTNPGGTVLDPFAGTGTTIIAAHRDNRTGYGIEVSPAYCDVICRRYQEHTGTLPVLDETREPHDFATGGGRGE